MAITAEDMLSSPIGKLVAALGWVAILFAGWKFYSAGQEPEYVLSADQLTRAFAENELHAQGKYGGKRVQVTGTFNESGVSLGVPWVIVRGKLGLISRGGVMCNFRRGSAADLPKLTKGQKLTVVGKVREKIAYVQLMGCELK